MDNYQVYKLSKGFVLTEIPEVEAYSDAELISLMNNLHVFIRARAAVRNGCGTGKWL